MFSPLKFLQIGDGNHDATLRMNVRQTLVCRRSRKIELKRQIKACRTKKPLHLIKKGGTVAITVSPFDGVSRIRFKGSHLCDSQSRLAGLPRNGFGFQYRLDSRSLCQRLQPLGGTRILRVIRGGETSVRSRRPEDVTLMKQGTDWTVCAT
jgi:hypothetical protein